MIKSVSIKNFRNLSELNIELSNSTVISGRNELGKSNALNAIMWLLTGTILTDKWGAGENDIDSIVPINAVKGINPEVTLYLETGTKFSKKYITKYSRDGEKVTGHTTEWYINDVACKNETEFTETLYPLINYLAKLKTKDVNELRLFVDPLYALQKLDAKSLRALLVDLGCSVTDEELYQMGFEDLRKYGTQYLGKWDVFRKSLKDTINVLTKDLEATQAKLETVASIEEYDDAELKKLNAELEALISKKATIKSGNVNPEIAEIEKEIAVLNNTISVKIANHNNDINSRRANLLAKRQLTLDKLNAEANSKSNPIKDEIGKIRTKLNEVQSSIRAYDITFNNNSSLMSSYIDLGNKNKATKTSLAIKLDTVRKSNYSNFILCPICGSEFPANEEEQKNFESHKQEEINKLMSDIAECEKKNVEYKAKYDECKKLKDEAVAARESAQSEMQELNNKLFALESELSNASNVTIDMTEVNKIDAEIAALNQPVDVSVENIQLNDLRVKLASLKNADLNSIQTQINEIDIAIGEVNEKISEEHIKKSKYLEKQEYMDHLSKTQTELNNNDSLLARCNELIQTMISLINEKATAKTGLTFVMLEENLSNDGVKEVCYATVNGIPFKDVNTATKIKYGIKFIEKMKELLGHNSLPILADRMEGIDSFDTIKNLTHEQLICTRVSDEEVITIR